MSRSTQQPRARLSAVLIVKDEAENMADCLAALHWADEIVVVDGGSRDDTVAKARRFTDQVHVLPDWPGYGAQRQRAQALASGDWILMVDADERVTPELKAAIQQVLADDDRSQAYELPRLTWCFGRYIRHAGWYPDYVLRLYPAQGGGYDDALVHEQVVLAAGVERVRLKGDLIHYSYRDLHHYLVKSAGYARSWADQRQAQGRNASLASGLLHATGCFLRMYLFKAGFLDGRAGLLLALLSAHSTFVKYADLWVRAQGRPPPAGG